MSAITAKASRKMKKYAVLTREPRCFLGSFDFSWEQRKLGDIASDMVAGGDIDKDLILAEGQYPVIANALTGDGIVGYYDKEYRVNAPAVTVTGRGDVGHAKARLVNFTPVVRLLSVKSEHDVFFLENAINTLKIVIESTGVPQLTVPQLAKYEVAFPRQLDEEEHIGAFFKQLDHLITLHQRKCVFLFGFFQAFISMIFTASTFSWEQRKLGELVDRVVRKNINNESTLPLTISAQYGLVDQITYFNNRVASRDVSNYYLVLNGEFAYNKSTSDGYPFGAVKRLDLYEKGVLSTLYIVFAPKKEQQIDSDYLTVFFDTDRWHKGVAERAAEGARNHGLLNISAEDFFDIDLSVPKDIVEQKQIGAFIRQLDNLITLHQRECISFTARAGRLILTANKKRNTSSWEQRKVQDVADRFDNLRIPVAANLRVHGTTPYYGANGIQDYVEGFTHDGEFVLVAEDGANDLKNYPVKCVNGRIWVNNHAHVLQGKAGIADNSFLAFAISQSDIESLLVGGGRAKLNAETLMSIEFRLPCLQEQYRIGEYLTQLDNLITLHQRKPFLMKWRTSDANRNQTNRLVL